MRTVISLVLFVSISLFSTTASNASVVTLVSGNGAGQNTPDSIINFVAGPTPGSPFASAFVAADFTAAKGGADARNLGTTIVAGGIHANWKPQLAGSTAEWISLRQDGAVTGGTALYAMDFIVGPGAITSATLDFKFLIDNDLGDAFNEGLFVNGVAVVGSKLTGGSTSFFMADQSFVGLNVTSLVVGTNTLYLNAANLGGTAGSPSGIQFDATFNITQVPEPTSFVMFGLALVGFSRRRR